jgi:AraC family transcriptional regulator of adaptative response / DNA-3-methyladenine glycosylase II
MARWRTLKTLAGAAVADPNLFRPFGSIEQTVARLRMIHGIGEWTAQYIALRAIREMDAFPSTDIGLLRGVASINDNATSAANLLSRAESWRPWRAYAAQHLWAADGRAIVKPTAHTTQFLASVRTITNQKGQHHGLGLQNH